MSLLNQPSPIDTFTQCTEAFIDNPNPGTGIELDDAVVALKRHARVQLKDEPLAAELERMSRPIRDQDLGSVKQLFDSVKLLLAPHV